MPQCAYCLSASAALKRPKTGDAVCKLCFLSRFEQEIHDTIISQHLFSAGERVAIAASGGKDSTVLAAVLTKLNRHHGYGLDLFLLSVDEGITGYRDDSLRSLQRQREELGLELAIVSYADLYGWTMDQIVQEIGKKNNCTFCGVFRRQALDRGAVKMKADKLVTGHNADDLAETVIMNILRGDISRLGRSVSISTGPDCPLPRVKPFKYSYEKEIVMYAHFSQLAYFSTECVYAPFAYRGFARDFIKQAESLRSSAIVDMVRSGEELVVSAEARRRRGREEDGRGRLRLCSVCGYLSSNELCKACVLLRGLNKGRARRTVDPQAAEAERKEGKEEERNEVGRIGEQTAGRAAGVVGGWEQAIDVNAAAHRQEVSAVFGKVRQGRAERGGSSGSNAFIIAEQMNSTSW